MKLSNPKIKAALVDTPGAIDALLAIGWMREQEPEEALVIPKGRHFTMAEVHLPSHLSAAALLMIYSKKSTSWGKVQSGSWRGCKQCSLAVSLNSGPQRWVYQGNFADMLLANQGSICV